jgi:ankyrin repeat protein
MSIEVLGKNCPLKDYIQERRLEADGIVGALSEEEIPGYLRESVFLNLAFKDEKKASNLLAEKKRGETEKFLQRLQIMQAVGNRSLNSVSEQAKELLSVEGLSEVEVALKELERKVESELGDDPLVKDLSLEELRRIDASDGSTHFHYLGDNTRKVRTLIKKFFQYIEEKNILYSVLYDLLNHQDHNGETPLHQKNISFEVAQYLINAGADVRVEVAGRMTKPLHLARTEKLFTLFLTSEKKLRNENEERVDRVDILIDSLDRMGRTPLFFANAEICEVILKAISDPGEKKEFVRKKDALGREALHYASDPTVVELLCKNEADVNARDQINCTPLHTVMYSKEDEHSKSSTFYIGGRILQSEKFVQKVFRVLPINHRENSHEILRELLRCGADVTLKDIEGNTPLHRARLLPEVQVLVEGGADVNAENRFGALPFHFFYELSPETISYYLEMEHLKVNHRDSCGSYSLVDGSYPGFSPLGLCGYLEEFYKDNAPHKEFMERRRKLLTSQNESGYVRSKDPLREYTPWNFFDLGTWGMEMRRILKMEET